MPMVYRMFITNPIDAELLVEAWSLKRPTRAQQQQVVKTAEYFFDAFTLQSSRLELFEDVSCRKCGCTEDRACKGGCSWGIDDESDLCSRCMDPI